MLNSEENHKQNKKTAYELGEGICKWCHWQGINFQNTLIAHIIQVKKNKQPNQKMSRRPK